MSCRSSWRCCSALSIYTAAFIAEIGAGRYPGGVSTDRRKRPIRWACARRPTLRLVVIPQAMRVIIPPLTSQYLNLTKNSSLAVAIGYPDLVQIVRRHGAEPDRPGGGGDRRSPWASICRISLVTSCVMNWYNKRIALMER